MKKRQLLQRATALAMCLPLCVSTFANGVSAQGSNGKYYTDFATYEEEQHAAEKLAAEIGGEGMTLLKNRNNTLPFGETVKNVTLFGGGSYFTVTGGGGSGAGSDSEYQTPATIVSSLTAYGFNINPTVQTFYEEMENLNQNAGGENMWSSASSVPYANLVFDPDCMNGVVGSYNYYNDAAIITISREGAEGVDKSTTAFDNGRTGADYAGTKYEGVDSHSLELFPEELELVEHAKQNFETVIVLINSSNAIELACLEDDPDIDAILWIGNQGTRV